MEIYGRMLHPPGQKEKLSYFKLTKNRCGKFQWKYMDELYIGTDTPLKPNGPIFNIPYDRFSPPFDESQLK